MKILVTGGCGFLGCNLVDKLISLGHSVVVFDSLQTSSIENLQHYFNTQGEEYKSLLCKNFKKNIGDYKNQKPFIYHSNSKPFTFVGFDIIDPIINNSELINDEKILGGKIDQIYHLACPASPPEYQKDSIHTLLTAVLGTHNILEIAKLKKARFLVSSTSEVYGDPDVQPQTENYRGNVNCTGPRACYDEGKRAGEALIFDYNRQHNVDIRVARIFNTYGPRMRLLDGRIISNFIIQCLTNQPITVYGKGLQTRSFCFVDDLIEGLISLMNSNCKTPVNLGNPDEYTILEMAEKIKNIINPQLEIKFCDLPVDDPVNRNPDIEKAKKELAWSPKITLAEGLEKTIKDFKVRIETEKEFLKEREKYQLHNKK